MAFASDKRERLHALGYEVVSQWVIRDKDECSYADCGSISTGVAMKRCCHSLLNTAW